MLSRYELFLIVGLKPDPQWADISHFLWIMTHKRAVLFYWKSWIMKRHGSQTNLRFLYIKTRFINNHGSFMRSHVSQINLAFNEKAWLRKIIALCEFMTQDYFRNHDLWNTMSHKSNAGSPSDRNPVSAATVSDSVVLCDTQVCFWAIARFSVAFLHNVCFWAIARFSAAFL